MLHFNVIYVKLHPKFFIRPCADRSFGQSVPENSLPGDLPYLLRLISREPPEETAKPAITPLAEAAAKFAVLISGAGARYEE